MNPDRCSNGNGSSHSFFFSFSPSHLLERLYLLGIVVAFEYIFCFGGRVPLPEHLKIHGMVSDVYGQIPIFAYAVFLGFGHSRLKAQKEDVPFNRIFFWAHFLCIAAVLSFTLVKQQGINSLSFDPFGYIKSAIYLLGTVLLVLACIPLHSWIVAIRATGRLWLYASLTGIAGWYLGTPVKLLWKATSTVQSGIAQRSTLYAVSAILGRFLPDMIVEPATFTIGSPRYLLVIAPGCSGVEGLGLVLLFTSIWLWYFKKEICFPQCFLLIPCALGCSWLLNIGRLCGLILIASAGFPEIAMAGFHIAAGWISFIIVALVFSLAMQKISWFQRIPSSASCMAGSSSGGHVELCAGSVEKSSEHRGESPEIRAYLVPFLAILAATFVSKAASGYFEWLYPLRFIAAAVALFYFWPELKKLDWRFSWAGPVAGVAVFLVWMAPTWRAGTLCRQPDWSSAGGAAPRCPLDLDYLPRRRRSHYCSHC